MSLPALRQAQALLSQGLPLTEEKAREFLRNDPEILVFVLLELARRAHQVESASPISPSTPSGMIPPYQKPPVPGRKKRPGRKVGHPGARRAAPPRIDRQVEHRLERCPDCGGPLQPCTSPRSVRTRIIEDIPVEIQPEITQHLLHRDYCPRCRKLVEPPVPDALPKATIGNRTLALTAYWHYGLGLPLSQILAVLNSHLHFPLTPGGLVQMWHRLAAHLQGWYEQIADAARSAAVLHADETGWRVNGETWWLWCFAGAASTYYLVDRNRGSPALQRFFQETFAGTLVTDFWAAYEAVTCERRQYCLVHLLRELEKVNERNVADAWRTFSRTAKRLFQDALRLRRRENFTPDSYRSRIDRLYGRLLDLALADYTDPDARRLAKRLRNYWDELLTFLEHPEVPSHNNHAEREIRPAVLMRKVSQGNRTERSAQTQAVLMTVFRTLKHRNLPPTDAVVTALRDSLLTGTLPPLPPGSPPAPSDR